MYSIADAVNAVEELDLDAFVDATGFAGRYLCEYAAYHATWYHDLHADPNDSYWNVAAGHIHVGGNVGMLEGQAATEISLRELMDYVDTQIPEPHGGVLFLTGITAVFAARRR